MSDGDLINFSPPPPAVIILHGEKNDTFLQENEIIRYSMDKSKSYDYEMRL